MSPVIYRPGGSGSDREPERPPRVSIAGPDIPTAASFTHDAPRDLEPVLDDLDDLEIDDDELAGEAADQLLDDGTDRFFDGDDEFAETAGGAQPGLQRRRRRILGQLDETPVPASDTGIGDEPEPDMEHEMEQEAPADVIGELEDPPAARPRARRVRSLHISPPPVGPGDEPIDVDGAQDEPPPAEPGPETSAPAEESAAADPTRAVHDPVAISGRVASTRGRGLSGVSIVVIDAADEIAGTAVTGRRGQFVVDHLADGTYRLVARDTLDGDFIDSWHGGDGAASATELPVREGQTIDDVRLTLLGRVAIDADVDVRRKKVVVAIDVIDRSTGLHADGSIVVSTAHFRTRLPLTKGRASITLLGTTRDADGAVARIDSRVRLEYPGSRHHGAATRTIRLR